MRTAAAIKKAPVAWVVLRDNYPYGEPSCYGVFNTEAEAREYVSDEPDDFTIEDAPCWFSQDST